MGLKAQLSSAEILEQVWHARAELQAGYEVRNVVFMGMGEPLDNYEALRGSLRGLTHQALFDLSAKHLTVSTVGACAAALERSPSRHALHSGGHKLGDLTDSPPGILAHPH